MHKAIQGVLAGLLALSTALVVSEARQFHPGLPEVISECRAEQGEAESCVRNMVWDAYPEGWAVRTITTAKLSEMEHRIFMLTLYAGNEYRLMSCGDKTMANVDLVLYDADGRLIVQDQNRDRQPTLNYKPEVTDTFYVAVHATERVGKGKTKATEKATVALAVTYK